MRCGYGLAAVPASDARLSTPETSFLRLRRTVKPIKAKIDKARRETSFYKLLGIPETGTLTEIKQAYKQLARKYHPDVSPAGPGIYGAFYTGLGGLRDFIGSKEAGRRLIGIWLSGFILLSLLDDVTNT